MKPSVSKPTDLVQGTLDLLILTVIALEPMHGWAIAQRISQMSGHVLRVGQSALYPSLHKLEQNGWISAKWATSDNNRRANKEGTAIDATMPMMVTTSRSSISVNPASERPSLRCAVCIVLSESLGPTIPGPAP